MKNFEVTISLMSGESKKYTTQAPTKEDVFTGIYHAGELYSFEHDGTTNRVRISHISLVSVNELHDSQIEPS